MGQQDVRPDDEVPGRAVRALRGVRKPAVATGVAFVLLLIIYGFVLNALRPHTPGRAMTLDEFLRRVNERKTTDITYLGYDNRFIGTDDLGRWYVNAPNNDFLTANIVTGFTEGGSRAVVRVDKQTPKTLLGTATTTVLPVALLIAGFAFIYTLINGSKAGGSDYAMLGKSKARRYRPEPADRVTFGDVAGLDEAIEELREVKEFLISPESYEKLGAKPPRGILLSGPPGCGKTLLAKAVAGEAGVPFFSVSASEFSEMLVGVGPSRVRDLFKQARTSGASIVFIDELDAVGRARSPGGEGLNAEAETTLNELLVQLDGFDAASRVVLMAATNRPDVLDSALVRRGRFDRQIVIDAPDFAGRLAIAKVHAKGKPMSPEVDLEKFARRTVGLTGADIAGVLNEAATLAARRRLARIGPREIGDAIERVQAGPERSSRILAPHDRERVAYHEAGHTIVGWVLSTTASVEKVSIVARGHSLGSTWNLPLDDRAVRTRSQMLEEIASALAGRAAENVVFGDPSGSGQIDLSRATYLARQMVYELGMSDTLGPLALGSAAAAGHLRDYSEEITQEAGREVRRILAEGEAQAQQVLTDHRPQLDKLAELLVARETLERNDLEAILEDLPTGGQPRAVARRRAAPRTTARRTGTRSTTRA